MKNKERIAEFLQVIADQKGLLYFNRDAYSVYQEMLETDWIEPKTARMILITLLAKIMEKAELLEYNKTAITALIQEECGLTEKIAEEISAIYAAFLSAENRKRWNCKKDAGLDEFCEKSWHFDLELERSWYSYCVHVDAEIRTTIDIRVDDKRKIRAEIQAELDENPWITAESILTIYTQKIKIGIADDFERYVQAEDDYPPEAEDYEENFEEIISEFCDRYGLELLDYSFVGMTSDYIPN